MGWAKSVGGDFFFFNDMAVSYTIEKAIYDENERIKTNFEDLEIKIGDEQ